MKKVFVPYDTIRDDAIKLAYRIYMGNVISEYFKFVTQEGNPVFYAAVVARSYTDINTQASIQVDGWTYDPDLLKAGDKVLLVDDVYDSGRTINYLALLFMDKGLSRGDIKVAVHDYKVRSYLPETLPIRPDYWCRKLESLSPTDETWIHYMSHELVGLTKTEIDEHYLADDPELAEAMSLIAKA
jgi:hypoxanthine phosphoribosyltransferase